MIGVRSTHGARGALLRSAPPTVPLPSAAGTLMFATGATWLRDLARARYGPAFGVSIPGMGRCLVVTDADLVRQVYRADPSVLHAANAIGPVLGGHSLFSLDGPEHLQQRKLLTPPFAGARLKAHRAVMREEAERTISRWPENKTFAVLPSMNTLTLRIIARTIFGADHLGDDFAYMVDQMPRAVRNGQLIAAVPALQRNLGPWSPGRTHQRFREQFDTVLRRLVDQARDDLRSGIDRSDMLSLLLSATYEDGSTLSYDELSDNLLALVVAGYETTAGTLAWAMERITRHPDVLRRLTDEARAGQHDLRQATIAEVQRTRPIVRETARRVIEPFALGDWVVPPGTTIITQASAIHDDDNNHVNASRFDPDRYLGRKIDQSVWIPFGGGIRRCIGAAFAQTEMDVVLATILELTDLQITTAAPERAKFQGITYPPAGGGRIRVKHVGDMAISGRPPAQTQ